MTDQELEALRFPIGRLEPRTDLTDREREELILEIASMPMALLDVVRPMSDEQLDTPYREGGWTVRQVVHHLADSHINGYVRFKLGMTEDSPAIKGYDQNLWGSLDDARTAPVELSLMLLGALHERWAMWLQSLQPQDFQRTVQHPEFGEVSLEINLQIYSWHGLHHLTHIRALRDRESWE